MLSEYQKYLNDKLILNTMQQIKNQYLIYYQKRIIKYITKI